MTACNAWGEGLSVSGPSYQDLDFITLLEKRNGGD